MAHFTIAPDDLDGPCSRGSKMTAVITVRVRTTVAIRSG